MCLATFARICRPPSGCIVLPTQRGKRAANGFITPNFLSRLEHLSDKFHELRSGVQKAIQIADADPEMALTRARKVLEYVIRDVYERRINEPPARDRWRICCSGW